MEWLNYNHLFYFWKVVKEGGISKAAEKLRLAQSTVSAQINLLEDNLGEELFKKEGRNLTLTEAGQLVYRYTDEIFSLGQEMRETLRGKPSGKTLQFKVGITDSLPKLIAYQLLQPAFTLNEDIYLITKEDHLTDLLGDLAAHKIDLILSDAPLPASHAIKAYNHLLGHCGISFFGSAPLKPKHNKKFPHFLDGAPFLLPGKSNSLRKNLEQWFSEKKIYPNFVAEFDDTALLKVFAQTGKGFFAAPTVIEAAIRKQFEVLNFGNTEDISEKFYAISIERKIKHPAVLAICEAARKEVF